MKKGIKAIEAQIDSVTAYRQGRGVRRDWERANREVDREEEAQLVADYKALQEARSLLSPPSSRITSIQGERVNSGYYDEPFGYCE